MTSPESFYVDMAKAIKSRDHAQAMVARWQAQVIEAEAVIESLVTTQHIDRAAKELNELPETS